MAEGGYFETEHERSLAEIARQLVLVDQARRRELEVEKRNREERAAEAAEKKQAHRDRLAARAAENEALVKEAAQREWIATGGNPDEFDRVWKATLREALLVKRVIDRLAHQSDIKITF